MICRDAVAARPGIDGARRAAGQLGDNVRASGLHDLGVTTHSSLMHYASQDCKRLLHNETRYAQRMSDPAERLRIARLRAGFATGKEAAEALGFPVSTYLSHENGSRGYPAKKAYTYARKFKVREQWLLYGVGPGPGESDDPKAEVVDIMDRLPPLKRAEALGYLRGLAGGKGE
jgi:hypothetical protein